MRRILSRSRKTSAREGGFTVLEVTITVSVLTLVIVSLMGVFVSVQRSQAHVTDRSQTLDELRGAMDRLSKELRQAVAVRDATATGLTMRTFVGGNLEEVTWLLQGDTLRRQDEWGRDQPVLDDVTNTDLFLYSPAAGAPLIVRVRLEVRPDQSPDILLELSSEVRLRNGS